MSEDYNYLQTILWSIGNIERHNEGLKHFYNQVQQKMKINHAEGENDLIEWSKLLFCRNRAIVTELITIGEAAKKVSKEVRQENPNIKWKDVIRMRDRLAHQPWDIDINTIEDTIANHLPLLKKQIASILPVGH